MTTTIKLGVGDDAVEVEDGASVPLSTRTDKRGLVIQVSAAGVLMQMPEESIWMEIHAETGEPIAQTWVDGIRVAIDLAALRLERAPKVETVGGWTVGIPAGLSSYMLSSQSNYSDCKYWTHRPGNTPEKQAAFDAALEAWFAEIVRGGHVPDLTSPARDFYDAARAIGYGRKR